MTTFKTKESAREALTAEIVSRIGFYLAQYGYQPWIREAINEAMESIERDIDSIEAMDGEVIRLWERRA